MLKEPEIVVTQTKALGRDEFAIQAPGGELLGTARQTLKMGDLVKASRGVEVFDASGAHVLSIEDPVDLIRDTYAVHLVDPPMQLARLTKRFAWIGSKFDVEIAGSPSEGISKMKIFCYDLMLISFARQRGLGIDFLIHDSTIFDGVDPRQRAHALELAASMAAKHGFQYICTLNTDMVPVGDFTSGFDYESLVRLRLTDTDPTGSLLGFRY